MSPLLLEVVSQQDATSEILIEVDDLTIHDAGAAAFVAGGERQAKRAFETGMRLIRTCANEVAMSVEGVRSDARPDEVEVQFGVKFSGEAGAFLTKAGVEAHLQVTLKWTKGA